MDPMRVFKTAIGNRTLKPVNVLFLGDSITEGYNVDTETARWTRLILGSLRSSFPTPGVAGGSGWEQMTRRPDLTFSQAWTWTGTGGAPNFGSLADGLAGWAASWTAAFAATASTTVTGTSFDLLYSKTPGWGFIDVTVDGTLVDSVDTSSVAHVAVVSKRYAFGSRGSHTIALTRHSGASISPHGIMVYDQDETAGIRGWTAGHAGWKTTEFLSTTNNARANFQATYNAVNPDLVTILLGYNDFNSSLSTATYKANIQALIADLKTSATNPSILLLGMFHTGSGATDTGLDAYTVALNQIAAADTDQLVSVLALAPLIPQVSGNPTYWSGGSVHPTNAGAALIGSAITTNALTFTDPGTSASVRRLVKASVNGAANRVYALT